MHFSLCALIEMMDDLGLEDVSFDESSSHADQTVAVTPYNAPDSARVSSLLLSCVIVTDIPSACIIQQQHPFNGPLSGTTRVRQYLCLYCIGLFLF